MENTKRLFVGGLCGNIKENELRDRFESFGQVSSVEIVRRKDEQGIPIKTFAYIDLGVTDIQLKKCISLLNNTKWKGNVMKVQQAKENFLSRLNREWKEEEKAQPEGTGHKPSAPEEEVIPAVLPGAVPGTPVPGKRNWVVGKFSRVLPVIYLRRRDNRKVAKFDPSKTAHSIKRLRCEEVNVPCAELTWDLDNSVVTHLNNQAGRERHHASNSPKYDTRRKFPSSSGIASAVQNSEITEKTENQRHVENCCDNDTKSLDKRTLERLMIKKQKNHDLCTADTIENRSKRCILSSGSEDEMWQKNEKKNQNCVIDGSPDSESSSPPCTNIWKKTVNIENGEISGSPTTSTGNSFESKLLKQGKKVLKKEVKRKKEQCNTQESVDSTTVNTSLSEDEYDVEVDITKKVKSTEMFVSSASDSSLISEDENDVENNITRSASIKSDVENDIVTRRTRAKENASDNSFSSGEENDFENSFVARQISNENTAEKNKRKQQRLSDSEKRSQMDTDNNKEKKLKRKNICVNMTNENTVSSNEARFILDSTNKQLNSNKRRLDAVQERNNAAISRKSVVHLALQNLDTNSSEQNLRRNHIVFEGDLPDDQVGERSAEDVVEGFEASHPPVTKISGSQAASWLGFHSDDSDEGNKEERDEVVSVKPHFEGKAGEKLFRLQKSFGRDQRFQMDERFLDSDEESDDEQVEEFVKQGKEAVGEGDAITKQLAEEKNRSLAVLQKVLGRNVNLRAVAASTDVDGTNREFGFLHYDPTREDHRQLEEEQTKSGDQQNSEHYEPMETEEVQANDAQVTTDRFYNVNTSSLADLFGRKAGDTSENSASFTFLPQEKTGTSFTFLPQEKTGEAIELREKPHEEGQMQTLTPRPWASHMLPYDSSGDESDDERADDHDDNDVTEDKQKVVPKDELFFFHIEDPNLANRLNDEDVVFMRTESEEELTRHWETVRSELTRDYKKKHKDAKRRQNKIAARRSNKWTV